MIKLFSSKGDSFLGIDIGSAAIKLVELSIKDKKPILLNYAWLSYSGNKTVKKSKLILELFKRAGFKSKDSYISLPAYSSFVTLIEFPSMKDEELEKAINFEANKYIPAPLDEVVLSWSVAGEKERKSLEIGLKDKPKGDKKVQVLLVAAPKRKVEEYEKLGKEVGLRIEVIELEIFSLARILSPDKEKNYLIVDVGAEVTNIVLVEKGNVKVNRTIDIGGADITRSIAEGMNISVERANKIKQGSADLFSQSQQSLLMPFLNQVTREVNRVVNSCYNSGSLDEDNGDAKGPGEKANLSGVESIILSGGTAKLKGLAEYFGKNFSKNVVVADPWSKVNLNEEQKKLVKELGPSFSVAVGLAMQGVEEELKN